MSDPYAAALSGAAGRSRQLDQILATLLRQAPDVEAAAVVSFDGLPMASALPDGMDEDRVAAMSAALLSLGERAAQGLGRGDLSQVYVEGDNGTVFLVSADDEAVLVAVGRVGAKVGLMLFEVRQAADAVGASLRTETLPGEPFVPEQPQHQPQPQPQPQQHVEHPQQTQQYVEPVQYVDPEPPAQVAEPVNGQQQAVPSVMPDLPPRDPQPQPVAVPVPREVRESTWDMHAPASQSQPMSNGSGNNTADAHAADDAHSGSHPGSDSESQGPDDRRHASVAPDGSAWS